MNFNIIDVFADDRVSASVDKLTLCGESACDIIDDDLEFYVSKYGENKYLFEEFRSNRFMSFFRLLKISYKHYYSDDIYEIYSIAIMIGFNGKSMCGSVKEKRKFQIEFNPNKFVIPWWLRNYFVDRCYVISFVKNIDLAFDFLGFRKSDFRYILNNANTSTAQIGTQNNKTDYIGFSNKSENRIKIYDKKKERSKYYHMDLETVRVEITLSYRHLLYSPILDSFSGEEILKSVNAIEQIYIADDISSDPFVYALSCLTPDQFNAALSLMSNKTKVKYKSLLKEQYGFHLKCNFLDLFGFVYESIEKILYDNSFLIDKLYEVNKNNFFCYHERLLQ